MAAMEAKESGAGSSPAPVQCGVRLIVGFPGYQEELRREGLLCQGVVDAQLDAYVGGSGEWATGADDDDDYEDECVAETWRDGGVLSEADA